MDVLEKVGGRRESEREREKEERERELCRQVMSTLQVLHQCTQFYSVQGNTRTSVYTVTATCNM